MVRRNVEKYNLDVIPLHRRDGLFFHSVYI